ncbi:unnamed protein product [Pieris brassicae]|uniref:Uncharacterized protein n=1 Tax=Pieris brassicae TaxID=7116 RepID=A0A9P0TNY0_PIEBR|nr:unnamed protein product [Pieris brassicae]
MRSCSRDRGQGPLLVSRCFVYDLRRAGGAFVTRPPRSARNRATDMARRLGTAAGARLSPLPPLSDVTVETSEFTSAITVS